MLSIILTYGICSYLNNYIRNFSSNVLFLQIPSLVGQWHILPTYVICLVQVCRFLDSREVFFLHITYNLPIWTNIYYWHWNPDPCQYLAERSPSKWGNTLICNSLCLWLRSPIIDRNRTDSLVHGRFGSNFKNWISEPMLPINFRSTSCENDDIRPQ